MANEIFKLFATIETNGKVAVKDIKSIDTQGSKTAKKLTKAFNGLAKVMKVAIVAGAAAATVAVVKMAKDGLEAFVEFEEGMNEVFTLLPGITQVAMDAMKEDVKSLAKEMGILPDEVVPALYQAISAGIPQENVFDFMEVASKAAIGGVTTLETAVDGLTSVVNAYGENVITVGEAADIMFTAVRLGKTTFEEMADRLFVVNPTAAALGVNFGEVAAAMAEITVQGVPTRIAANQLRSMFDELSRAGSEVSEIFEEIAGRSFREFMDEGGSVADALQLLAEYSEENGVQMKDMFGNVEAGNAVLALTGRHLDSFKEKIGEMADSAGAADAAHARMAKGLKKQWDKIKAWWATVKINIGERLQEPVQKFITFLSENQNKIEDFVTGIFDKLIVAFQWVMDNGDLISEGIKAIGVALGIIVAVKIVTWASGAVTAFSTLAGVVGISNPLALGLAAIAVLLGGLIYKLDEAENDAATLAEGSSTAFGSIGGDAEQAADRVAMALDGMSSSHSDLIAKWMAEDEDLQAKLSNLTEEQLAERQRMEEESARERLGIIEENTAAILRAEDKFQNDWIDSHQEGGEEVAEEHESIWDQLVSLTKTGWKDMIDKAESGVKVFYGAMSDMGDNLKSLLSSTFGDMLNTVATYWSDKEEAAVEHEERLLTIEEEHAENVAELNETHREDMLSADEDYAEERADIEQDYADEVEKIDEDSQERRENATKDFHDRMADLETNHGQSLEDALTTYNNRLEKEDIRYMREKEDLETDYLRDIAKLEADDFEGREKLDNQYKEDLADADTKHHRRRLDLETDYNYDVSEENKDHHRDEVKLQEDFVDDVEKIDSDSQDDRETALGTYHDDIEKAVGDHADDRETIESDYSKAIEGLQEDRQTARDDEVTAYGNQERSLGEILWDIVKMSAEALKQQLLVSAAYHLVEAVAWSLIPPLFVANPSAIGHYAAVAVLGAAGLGLAAAQALFGFAEGGMVSGPTLGMVGEGQYTEAVLPLSPAVFADIGAGIVGAMSEVGGGVGGDLRPLGAAQVEININIEEAYIRDEAEAEDLSNLLAERLAVEVRSIGLVAA